MYKKDYERLANLVAEHYSQVPRVFLEELLQLLKEDNVRFDKYKFIIRVAEIAIEINERKKVLGKKGEL